MHGTARSPKARSRAGAYCRKTLRITFPPGMSGSTHASFRNANLFSLNGETYTPLPRDCQGKGRSKTGLLEKEYSRDNGAVGHVLHRLPAIRQPIGLCNHRFRVEAPLLDQLHEPRDVAHHVQPTLLT